MFAKRWTTFKCFILNSDNLRILDSRSGIKAAALENAAKGITVNAVCPGYVATDLIAGVADDMMARIVSGIPVGRIGEPDEIARCVLFLVADEAGFITGSTLSVNGGAYMI